MTLELPAEHLNTLRENGFLPKASPPVISGGDKRGEQAAIHKLPAGIESSL